MSLRDLTGNAKVVALRRSLIISDKQWPTSLYDLTIDAKVVTLGITLVTSGKTNSTINNQRQRSSKKDLVGRKYINTTN